jgi:hypothetical protein
MDANTIEITGMDAISFWASLRDTVAVQPGVESVVLVSPTPLGRSRWWNRYPDLPDRQVTMNAISPDVFKLMEIPIVRGRTFDASDDYRRSVIVGASIARAMYGTIEVLGNGFPKTQPARTIVGVVADTRLADAYVPLNPEDPGDLGLVVRAKGEVEDLVAPLRQAAGNATRLRSIPLADVRLLKTDFYERAQGNRSAMIFAAVTASLTLALACLGIVGLVSYGTNVRRKEIGIRIALGASRRSIAFVLVKQLVLPVAFGAFIGIVVTRIAARFVAPETFIDTVVMFSVAAIVLTTTAAAAALPGLRAWRGDSLRALRCE